MRKRRKMEFRHTSYDDCHPSTYSAIIATINSGGKPIVMKKPKTKQQRQQRDIRHTVYDVSCGTRPVGHRTYVLTKLLRLTQPTSGSMGRSSVKSFIQIRKSKVMAGHLIDSVLVSG